MCGLNSIIVENEPSIVRMYRTLKLVDGLKKKNENLRCSRHQFSTTF